MKKRAIKEELATETSSQKLIDENTLRLLRARDSEFLKDLFSEVNPYLNRVCLANGFLADDVKELIQQTWEKFFTNLDLFEGRSQIRTFICGILFNKIREHRRLQKRYVLEEDSQTFMDNAFTIDGWWKVAPGDPCRIAELKQAAQLVRECCEGLTEQQMTAFVMKEVEDEDSEDVCNVLGVNISYLRVLIFRAKEKLRKCLEGKVSAEQV
jgi:RNA polymerase sigma-70 factor (ECF subfamily)